jgi:cyanophycin synthetase
MDKFGYQYGLGQTCVAMNVAFGFPEDIQFDAVDNWLESILGIECCPPNLDSGCEAAAEDIAALYIWRVMLIAESIRQASRLPVFGGGKILELKREWESGGQWEAKLAVPQVDGIPAGRVKTAYDVALKLLIWIAGNHQSPERAVAFLQDVHEKVIIPMRSMFSPGLSSLPILNVVHQRQIPFRHLGGGIYQLGWGCRRRAIQISAVDTDSAIGGLLSGQKHLTATMLGAAGLPVPEHRLVGSEQGAIKAAELIGWPVVVKPADRNRGEGVSVGIDNQAALLTAFGEAAELSGKVLVEKEVPGVCHRLFISNGAFLYATKRRPIGVAGDGQHSVAELAQAANQAELAKAPWLRQDLIPVDAEAMELLSSKGLGLNSVPRENELVPFRMIESGRWGGIMEDVSHLVHPDNIRIAIRAAEVCGLYNTGIDVLTTDIARPWHETGAVIIEANFGPALGTSEASRKRLPTFIENFVQDDGRIPVEVFVGNEEAMALAKSRQAELIDSGISCYLTSQAQTISSQREAVLMAFTGVFNRSVALLMNSDVEALILVVQDNELLTTGLPVDKIQRLSVSGRENSSANIDQLENVINLLKMYE